MKVEWTANQINPGIVVGAPGRAERWMVGYMAKHPMGEPSYTLNSLTDGMVQGPWTKEEIAARLTKNNELPAEVLDAPRYQFRKPSQE